jgi:hypothetical protein
MQRRPKSLDYFSWFLIGLAVSFPVQIMFLYGHSPLEFMAVASKISLLNWVSIACLVWTAVLLMRASPLVKYSIPVTIVAVTANNWVVGQMEMDYSPVTASLATLGFISVHVVLCRETIVDLLTHPEKRWWLRPSRHKVEVQAYVSPLNGVAFKAKTFEISESGVFIPMDDSLISAAIEMPEVAKKEKDGTKNRLKEKVKITPLKVNDRITLCLTFGLSQIRCDALVVRRTDARGLYPEGVGLRFEGISRSQRRDLKRYLSHTPALTA